MNYKDALFSAFSGPAAVLTVDGDVFDILDINDSFQAEIGVNLDKGDFLKEKYINDFDEDNRTIFVDALKRCIERKEETVIETRRLLNYSCCGESLIFIRSRLIYFEDENGRALVYESIRNITKERNNLNELIESERKFKIASEQINIYYWEYTIATREMRPCFRCMRDLGLPALVKNYPEPAIEMGIFPPDYADMYREWHKQLAAGVKELEADIPLTVARVPFRVKYTTEFDENGNPVKAYGSATLISETELNRIKLDNSIIEAIADQYDSFYLVDLIKDTVKVIRHDESIGVAAPREDSYSTSIREVIEAIFGGQNAYKLADIDYIRKNEFKRTNNREYQFKNIISGKWCRVTYKVVEKVNNEVTKMLVTYEELDDVMAAKMEAESLIARQKEELEKNKEQLEIAVAEANRANRAKSDFLARMSHEMRTPMNAIMGMNEIIIRSTKEEKTRGYAQDAYYASEGLLGTINEILDFSKIESGKMELMEDFYSTDMFLKNIYSMFAMRAEDKNLAFVIDIDSKLPARVKGDELRVRQVIANLLSNAVKYTDEGTVYFTASLKSISGNKATLFFEVKDTGRGIKEENMSSLFAEFERIDEHKSKNIEGTGLGMSIVLKLLNMMGSSLDVKSEYGKGSTFSFAIEQEIEDYVELGEFKATGTQEEIKEEKPLYVNDGKRILVVDDNAVNLKVFTALLRETKIIVEAVNSGAKAIEAAQAQKYDMIFMDHYMPEMSGPEAMKEIVGLPEGINKNTPFIALTANAIKGAREEYEAMGFSDVVFKPTKRQDLNEMLWKYLG